MGTEEHTTFMKRPPQQQSKPTLRHEAKSRTRGYRPLIVVAAAGLAIVGFLDFAVVDVPHAQATQSYKSSHWMSIFQTAATLSQELEPQLFLIPAWNQTSTSDEVWAQWAVQEFRKSHSYTFESTLTMTPKIQIHFPFADISDMSTLPVSNDETMLPPPPPPQVTSNAANNNPFALLTMRGNKYDTTGVRDNQDRASILSPFLLTQHYNNSKQQLQQQNWWWLGLLDGHGTYGHVVAHAATLELSRLVLERIVVPFLPSSSSSSSSSSSPPSDQQQGDTPQPQPQPQPKQDDNAVKQLLKEIFLQIHQKNLPRMDGGSVGIGMLRLDNKLYISNLGDAKAFVASWDPRTPQQSAKILYETSPHLPGQPEERSRIEQAGGEVYLEEDSGKARLIFPYDKDTDSALAMSRSFGNWKAPGSIAEPTTDVVDLSNLDSNLVYLAVAGSDGILDRLALDTVVATHLAKHRKRLLPAVEQLLIQSAMSWRDEHYQDDYRDDMTLVVHGITSEY